MRSKIRAWVVRRLWKALIWLGAECPICHETVPPLDDQIPNCEICRLPMFKGSPKQHDGKYRHVTCKKLAS